MAEDMSGRLRDSLLRRRGATPSATDSVGDVATDGATHPATQGATDVATRVATGGALRRRTQEATVRRAYTVYTRQDELLEDLARELRTDKSDVLRQIVDAWLATQ